MWFDEPQDCPDCGGKLIDGSLHLSSTRSASLIWESSQDCHYRKRNLFGRECTVHKPLRRRLMTTSVLLDQADAQEAALYCPACGRVFIRFKVGNVEILP